MKIRIVLAAAATVFAAMNVNSAQALSMQECSAKYKAANAAGTLNGMKWNDFRKAECSADATAAPAAAAPPAAAPAAPTAAAAAHGRERPVPHRGIAEIFVGIGGQGPHAYLPRPIQGQQGRQRQRRPEMDPVRRRLLQPVQQAPEGLRKQRDCRRPSRPATSLPPMAIAFGQLCRGIFTRPQKFLGSPILVSILGFEPIRNCKVLTALRQKLEFSISGASWLFLNCGPHELSLA